MVRTPSVQKISLCAIGDTGQRAGLARGEPCIGRAAWASALRGHGDEAVQLAIERCDAARKPRVSSSLENCRLQAGGQFR